MHEKKKNFRSFYLLLMSLARIHSMAFKFAHLVVASVVEQYHFMCDPQKFGPVVRDIFMFFRIHKK